MFVSSQVIITGSVNFTSLNFAFDADLIKIQKVLFVENAVYEIQVFFLFFFFCIATRFVLLYFLGIISSDKIIVIYLLRTRFLLSSLRTHACSVQCNYSDNVEFE